MDVRNVFGFFFFKYRALFFRGQLQRPCHCFPEWDVLVCGVLLPPSVDTSRIGVLRTQKLRTPLVGAHGYQMFPLVEPGVGIEPILNNMLLPGHLSLLKSASRFILIHFPPNLSKQRLVTCLELWKDFELRFRSIVFCSDINETVDWAFICFVSTCRKDRLTQA